MPLTKSREFLPEARSGLCLLQLLLFFGAACFLLAAGVTPAQALSAKDLIVVYNRNLPESKAVADYYAQKRGVPAANLVGVEVSTSEDMGRAEYDTKLVPPIKEMVAKARAAYRSPVILLVYGIPLRLAPMPDTKADQDLKVLAANRERELSDQALAMVQKLNKLTGYVGTAPKRMTYPPAQIFKMGEESLIYADKALSGKTETRLSEADRSEVTGLMVQLRGASPAGRALMALTRRGAAGRGAIRPQELQALNAISSRELDETVFRGILPQSAQENAHAVRSTYGLLGELRYWGEAQGRYHFDTGAAVDSELTLILAEPYQHHSWLPNPYFPVYDRLPIINRVRATTLMVSRLDGPTPQIARRLVDDAMETEKKGLRGVFYIDARGLSKGKDAYAQFDRRLINLYDQVKKLSSMKVVLDDTPQVFAPGTCPDAALYCGWYSLATYVPSCTWVKGAVGYHIASAEATTLKKPGSNVWCKRMLEEGVAATLGPVNEPYLHSFPLPEIFFPLLMSGKLPLVEVYFRSLPALSWMQILIGDPLYNPFKTNPALKETIKVQG